MCRSASPDNTQRWTERHIGRSLRACYSILHPYKTAAAQTNCGSLLFSFLSADDAVISTGGELVDDDIEEAEHQKGADVGHDHLLQIPQVS